MTLRKTLSNFLILVGFLIAVWGRFTLLVGLPFFLIGVILNFTTDRKLWAKIIWTVIPILLWLPFMLSFWFVKNQTVSQGDTYIYPKGFHGQTMLAFGAAKGDTITIKNGRRIFTFDTSGVLITQGQAPKGIVDQQFFFQDQNGRLTPILTYSYMVDKEAKRDSSTIKVFGWHEIGSTGAGDCSYKFKNFIICSLAELDTIDNGFKSWKMHDEIKQALCGQ